MLVSVSRLGVSKVLGGEGETQKKAPVNTRTLRNEVVFSMIHCLGRDFRFLKSSFTYFSYLFNNEVVFSIIQFVVWEGVKKREEKKKIREKREGKERKRKGEREKG